MSELKQKLVELIEAYAAAKATANALLIQTAGAALVGYLEGIEIHESKQPDTEQADA